MGRRQHWGRLTGLATEMRYGGPSCIAAPRSDWMTANDNGPAPRVVNWRGERVRFHAPESPVSRFGFARIRAWRVYGWWRRRNDVRDRPPQEVAPTRGNLVAQRTTRSQVVAWSPLARLIPTEVRVAQRECMLCPQPNR